MLDVFPFIYVHEGAKEQTMSLIKEVSTVEATATILDFSFVPCEDEVMGILVQWNCDSRHDVVGCILSMPAQTLMPLRTLRY